jgi:hypothetical protein
MTGMDNLELVIGANVGKSKNGHYGTLNIPLDTAKEEEKLYTKATVPLEKDEMKGRYTIGFTAVPEKWENQKFQISSDIIDHTRQDKKVIARSVISFQLK